VVANLKRAGAIIIGLTNTREFSMRGFTDNQLHGLTKNPWDSAITCGGRRRRVDRRRHRNHRPWQRHRRLAALASQRTVLTGFAIPCVDITSQLYLLDHAPRQALRHFEPTRIFSSAAPWTFGPWLGVYLQENVAFTAPFAVVAITAIQARRPAPYAWPQRRRGRARVQKPAANPLRFTCLVFLATAAYVGMDARGHAPPGGACSLSTRRSSR
jgi:hypothetical protein